MQQVETVKARLDREIAVVSVGSGVVTDITKHACYLFEQETGVHIPFTVYQTANSVSAYASDGAPLFVQGVKRTFRSRYPDALVCDLETLRDAPREMTISGVGDMLAIYGSLPDWYLAHEVGIDPNYTEIPRILLGPLDQLIYQNLEEIRTGSLAGMALLARLITLGGIAMSVSHSTAPLSGYEHLVSHILDLQNEQAGQALPLHGTQIALAMVVCAAAYEHFIQEFDPGRVSLVDCFPNDETMERRILQSYQQVDPSGKAGVECWSDYRKKLGKWNTVSQEVERFLKEWPEIREELVERTRPAQYLKDLFEAVGGPKNFAELQPPAGEDQVKFAFLNSPYMRNRFTLGDLFIFLNWDQEKLWGQIWRETQVG
jgi:glycerol-1-phosphate dehydrogenase [NAD(P)+]